MKRISLTLIGLCLSLLFIAPVYAQFSHADSLRGSMRPQRAWWDVNQYDISVRPDMAAKTISGMVEISFTVVSAQYPEMQVDLQMPMQMDKILFKDKPCASRRDGNAFFIRIPEKLPVGAREKLVIHFSGKPRAAVNPPWDGGWIWKKDAGGNDWVSVACQGLGASVWYPCKDHQSDEPDSARLRITLPEGLVGVGNGRLRSKTKNDDGTLTWNWAVVNPINNYNIIPYIGKYVNWGETYMGEKGKLDCEYWVLDYNETRARKQFQQVKPMLKCFEYWMGPYPFYEDSYKLVESPHLGMEHQSAVAYGNKFQNGYLGTDLSGTGWGLKWDFILVHESGHEWFANNITTKDLADMWVHEGFTNYTETLFTECQSGKEAGSEYCRGVRKNVDNDKPIIAAYHVNQEGSGDMYYKGGNMIHTIRHIINDDEKFRSILRGLNKDFYHQTVTSAQVEKYISQKAGINLSKVFDQYLRTVKIPRLDYFIKKNGAGYELWFSWNNTVKGFDMPVKVKVSEEKTIFIKPKEAWSMVPLDFKKLPGNWSSIFDKNFYYELFDQRKEGKVIEMSEQ